MLIHFIKEAVDDLGKVRSLRQDKSGVGIWGVLSPLCFHYRLVEAS